MLRLWTFTGVLASLLSAHLAFADVVQDRPLECPEGTNKALSHDGPYCAPPKRMDCPPGYATKLDGNAAFCEAPPAEPCPKGTEWTTFFVDKPAGCFATIPCNPSDSARSITEQCSYVASDATCEETSYCIRQEKVSWRKNYQLVVGACKTDNDCKAFPETKCIQAKLCDSAQNHKNEADRIEAAKNVKSVPEPYFAKEGGPPPPYIKTNPGPQFPGGTSSSASASSSSSAASDPKPANGRCGCRLAGADDSNPPWILMAITAAMLRLRRKTR